MIEQIKVRGNPRFVNSDLRTFNFKPGINLILGANTSGKTSLLNIAKYYLAYDERTNQNLDHYAHYEEKLKRQKAKVLGNIGKLLVYKPEELKEQADLRFFTGDLRLFANSKFQSNGEGRRNYHEWFSNLISSCKTKDLVIIADEPENSMAINMQFGLFKWFYDVAKINYPNIQIIIASHSLAAFHLAKKKKMLMLLK